MATTTEFKRLFLRGIKWDSVDQEITLADALKAASRSTLSNVNGGLVLIGSAGNGTSTTFALPSGRGVTPTDVTELCERLLTEYDAAVAFLGDDAVTTEGEGEEAEEVADDNAIFAQMLLQIVPVRESYSDFSAINSR